MDSPGHPVPWAETEALDPVQDAIRGLARQPTFTGEEESGKRRAGARFLHRCCLLAFIGSFFPLTVAWGLPGGVDARDPWLKGGTAAFTLVAGLLSVRTRSRPIRDR